MAPEAVPRADRGSPKYAKPKKAVRARRRVGFFEKAALGRSKRAELYEELADYISNKISLAAALEEIRLVVDNGRKKPTTSQGKAIAQIRTAITSRGADLAEAMAPFSSQTEQLLIKAGQKEPVEALRRAARLLRTTDDAVGRMVAGLTYPFALLNAIVLALFGFAVQIMPTFASIYPVEKWVGMAAVLAHISLTVRDSMLLGYATFFFAAAAIVLTLPIWTGPLRARLDLFFPWALYRTAQGASFLLALSALLGSGQRLPVALDFLSKDANPWLSERLRAVRKQIKGGDENLGVALREAGFNFPAPDLIRRLIVISQFSTIDAGLEELAQAWIERTRKAIDAKIATAGAACMMIVILTITFIGVGLLDIAQQIGTGVGAN